MYPPPNGGNHNNANEPPPPYASAPIDSSAGKFPPPASGYAPQLQQPYSTAYNYNTRSGVIPGHGPTAFYLPNSTTMVVSSTQMPSGGGQGMMGGGGGGYEGPPPMGGCGPQPNVKVIYAAPLGPDPVRLECGNCNQLITTRAIQNSGLLTWLLCGGLALVGCWPCCLIPFCVDSCQDTEHHCPNCNAFIGRYRRI